MSLTLQSTIKLRDGNEMPILGFGVYEMDGREAYDGVTWALEAGYRLIDSAAWYENEKECGRAILDFCERTSTPRSSIFFTTKLRANKGLAATRRAIQASIDECGLGYIDLYLVHGPLGGPRMRKESWEAICEARTEGKLKSIGVSNYGVQHLKEMLASEGELPSVNQVDLHPFMARADIVALCRKHDIVLEAWAPLVRGLRFKHPAIVKLAKKYERDPAQILIRYSLQKGYVPLPKSVSQKRIISNSQVFDFELSEEDVVNLYDLDEALVTDWDPTECE